MDRNTGSCTNRPSLHSSATLWTGRSVFCRAGADFVAIRGAMLYVHGRSFALLRMTNRNSFWHRSSTANPHPKRETPVKRSTRRSFLKRSFLTTAVVTSGPALVRGDEKSNLTVSKNPDETYSFQYSALGSVKPRRSSEIEASPLSVGFETLDRKMFTPERTYEHLAKLGVKWARVQTGWARTETTRGVYDFAWLDEVVDNLRKIGIQPWFNFTYGNRLYTPDAPDASAVGWAPVFSEEARQGWLRYTRAIAEHFADRVTHWEIWNESNITVFWKPKKANPLDYTELVKVTAPEIRKRVPGAVIIGGAFAGVPTSFMAGCMKAGMGDYVDRISFHPYQAVPEKNLAKNVDKWREIIGEYNPTLRLWQGENGCPSKGGKNSTGALSKLDWTEIRQAKWVTRRILSDLGRRLELTSYFHTVDLCNYNWGRGASDQTNYKGLLRGTDYTPKPAYYAYQTLCALFDAETSAIDESPEVRVPGVEESKIASLQTLGFQRHGKPLFAYWAAANMQTGWTAVSADLVLPAAAAGMKQPVLVDPLSGKIFALPAVAKQGATLVVKNVPLLDYPLLVTDRSVVLNG